ncbi:MAG: galactose-phosphate uridylyltransferase [Actinomycetota bacterium]|jgi:UDPglucose--hexose-1-phosphate uridylyltransferase
MHEGSSTSAPDDGRRHDVRTDPHHGSVVHVVGTRQTRPNLPSTGCPFCPGGLEAPEPYDVRWFRNRWPAMQGDRCEVVLYTSRHDATFWELGVDGALRVIDLWTERFAELGARDDVDYVLIFENRGPEVGATIAHPHGQIYAYDHVPARPAHALTTGWTPDLDDDLVVASHGSWTAFVPYAPTYPVAVTIAPRTRVSDLTELDAEGRRDLATSMIDVLARLDRLYDRPLPYMMWFHQQPTVANAPEGWLRLEIVSPWRSAGTARFIAAAEVACEEYFNPVVPEDLAARLRQLGR